MKALENLRWKPLWVSHIGCIKGCIDYLGLDVSLPWLFGATGHALIINIREDVCPSAPTAWKKERFFELGRNVGFDFDGVLSSKAAPDFKDKKKQAWEMIKAAIDNGQPCYGWELNIPEFYVVYGYDDVGYYYRGALCEKGEGPKPWEEVGETKIGWLEMFVGKKCVPADVRKQVKDALGFALEFSKSPEKYIFPKFKAGLDGYDLWCKALEEDKANGFGMAYNAEVWAECREFAVKFMIEAKDKIGKGYEKLFDDAIAHYRIVADNLEKVQGMFPFCEFKPEHIKDESRIEKAIGHIKEARRAEEYCLILLQKIYKEL
ncbi:hypothetical protein KKB18_01795 [bacterium]|nr:hypothetical protein [bacterium]